VSEEEAFKVTDRRRRADDEEPAPSVASAPPGPAETTAAPRPEPSRPEPSRIESPSAPPPDELDLQGLFVMFASSALIGLGAAPDPMTGLQRVDLDQAQEAIETLLLLRVKTEGNRTEAESRLLEQILYDLQMRFVRVTEGGGAPGPGGPAGGPPMGRGPLR
jgi:Domain of unknown function (DUF1844)